MCVWLNGTRNGKMSMDVLLQIDRVVGKIRALEFNLMTRQSAHNKAQPGAGAGNHQAQIHSSYIKGSQGAGQHVVGRVWYQSVDTDMPVVLNSLLRLKCGY